MAAPSQRKSTIFTDLDQRAVSICAGGEMITPGADPVNVTDLSLDALSTGS